LKAQRTITPVPAGNTSAQDGPYQQQAQPPIGGPDVTAIALEGGLSFSVSIGKMAARRKVRAIGTPRIPAKGRDP